MDGSASSMAHTHVECRIASISQKRSVCSDLTAVPVLTTFPRRPQPQGPKRKMRRVQTSLSADELLAEQQRLLATARAWAG
jgi:hypothetical protein